MPAPVPALIAALARLPPPGELRGLLTGLPARTSRRLSGLLRTVADRLAGLPADALPAQANLAQASLAQPSLAPPPRPPAEAPAPGRPQGMPTAAPTAGSIALARAEWADRLWEDGCLLPGGVAEIQRLSGLLPLSPATTLLLVGRDGGGATATIIGQRGAWVAVHQQDAALAERMQHRLRSFGRRATVLPWQPEAPAFRKQYHHHALALEPTAGGGSLATLLPALATALKPDAQLVLLDIVSGPAAAAHRPALDRWLTLEGRAGQPPSREAAEAAIQSAGFQLHVAEDAGPRQCAAVTEGWARLIGGMRGQPQRTPRSEALALITEAELWLLRHRLLTAGAIGLFRWHATLRR